MGLFEILFSSAASLFSNKLSDILNDQTLHCKLLESDQSIRKELQESLDDYCYEAVDHFFAQQVLWGEQNVDKSWITSKADKTALIKEFYTKYSHLRPFSQEINPMLSSAIDLLYSNLVNQLNVEHRLLFRNSVRNTHKIILSQQSIWKKQEMILEKILSEIPKTATIRKISSVTRRKYNFFFNNIWVDLAGRDDELHALTEFLGCNLSCCWWAITGPGGVGKSRLVWELAAIAECQGMHVYYQNDINNDSFDENSILSDELLFIFDDVVENTSIIASFLNRLSWLVNGSVHIRILFVEREGTCIHDASWMDAIIEKCIEGINLLRLQCFDQNGSFLVLNYSSDESIKSIIRQYISYFSETIDEKEILQLIERLHGAEEYELNEKRLPLYALIVADGWLHNKKVSFPLSYHFEILYSRERRRILAAANELQETNAEFELLNMICISTAIKSIDSIVDKSTEYSLEIHELRTVLDRKYSIPGFFKLIGFHATGNSDTSFSISGIQPDILGENFVYRYYLSDKYNSDKYRYFIAAIWRMPIRALLFLIRLYQDFPNQLYPNNPFTDYLLSLDETFYQDRMRRKYYCMLLLKLAQIYGKQLMTRCEKKLREIYAKNNENDVGWRLVHILMYQCSNANLPHYQEVAMEIFMIYKSLQTIECYKPLLLVLEKLRDLQSGDDRLATIERLNEIKYDFKI